MLLPRNLLGSPQPGESLLSLSSHPADRLDLSEVLSYSFFVWETVWLSGTTPGARQIYACMFSVLPATCVTWNT